MVTCNLIEEWQFGPAVNAACQKFDFTLFFETVFLSALPSALLIACLPFRLFRLRSVPIKTRGGLLLRFKLVNIGLLTALHLALLILATVESSLKQPANIAAGALAVAASGAAALLLYYEHVRSVSPSTILEIYFLVVALLDAARARTLWLINVSTGVATTMSVVLASDCIAFLAECSRKTALIIAPCSIEETSGICERALFSWLLPMLWHGYHDTLSTEDLPTIDSKLGSEPLHHQLEASWRNDTKGRKHALMLATLKAYRAQFAAAAIPRLCWTAAKFAQPFLINTTITWVSSVQNHRSLDSGYGLIGAFGLVYTCIAVSQALYWQQTYRFIVMVRGGLISSIFRKTIELNPSHKLCHDPMVLMGTDIEKIALSLRQVHEVWASMIEVALALWLLERQLDEAFVAPAILTLACLVGTILLSGKTSARQRAWMHRVQERLGATSTVLGDMKAVKLLGLSDSISSLLRSLRVKEVETSRGYRTLLMWSIFLGGMPQLMSPALTFAVYAIISATTHDSSLLTGQAFTSVSLIALLTTPLNQLVQAAPQLLACSACAGRIQEYLEQPQKETPENMSFGILPQRLDNNTKENLPGLADVTEKQATPPSAFLVEHATFQWPSASAPALRDINLEVPTGTIGILAGPIGSGKSSLLQSILGNTMIVKGSVSRAPISLSYCSQNPWLISGTIYENITMGSSYDPDWYQYTLWACSLDRDIRKLPMADLTQVGSKGAGLSGGQKQRVAMARMVYSRARLALCDDVFSGLDAVTECIIVDRLFSKDGYFRRHGVTVLLATHSRTVLPLADRITLLSEDGCIHNSGSFAALRSKNVIAASINHCTSSEVVEYDHRLDEKDNQPERNPSPPTSMKTSEYKTRQTGDGAVYIYYAKAAGSWLTISFLTFTMLCTFCESFAVLWLQWWTKADTSHPNQAHGLYLGIYIFFNGLGSLLLLLSCWLNIVRMTSQSALNLHEAVLQTVFKAPLSFFVSTDTGITTNRFSQDMELIDMTLPLAALNATFSATSCIMQIVLVIVVAKYLAAVIPLVMVVVFFLQRFYLRTSRQVRLIEIEEKAPLYTRFLETVAGLATIQAYGWQEAMLRSSYRLLDLSQRPFYLLFCVQLWVNLVLNLVVAGLSVLLMALVVTLTSKTSAGFVGVALVTIMNLNMMLMNLVKYWTMLETSVGAVSRIKSFVSFTEAESEPPAGAPLEPSWPQRGGIGIADLTVSHSVERPAVLRNISLSVLPGEKIAICGKSGSGKSTLVLALLRTIDTYSGHMRIDSIDLSSVSRDDVRRRLNVVPQDPFFCTETYRTNLDPHGESSDDNIASALESTGVFEAVKAKGGLDSKMKSDEWSVGEKQLLCLARAMLRRGNILILDEAMSSVDLETERRMQCIIDTAFAFHTVLSVMHRFEHVLKYDKVALLHDGELIEFEEPKALLARNSRFAALYASRRYN